MAGSGVDRNPVGIQNDAPSHAAAKNIAVDSVDATIFPHDQELICVSGHGHRLLIRRNAADQQPAGTQQLAGRTEARSEDNIGLERGRIPIIHPSHEKFGAIKR